jgi:AcrR family transcriptional regulator
MSATITDRRSGADPRSARERLLAAANELFYQEGVHTVGIDRVIERAGVAKASLYNTFGSKDELIKAYLAGRHTSRQERITRFISASDTPQEQLLAVFDAVSELVAEPSFRGCAFMNASAESADSGVTTVCDDSRAWTRSLFTRLAQEAGAADPAGLAAQLVLIYDGVVVGAQMDHNPAGAATAKIVAEALVNTAIPR